MTKIELVEQVAKKTDISAVRANLVFDAIFDLIQQEVLLRGKLTITGFGSFEVREHQAKQGKHPRNGTIITIKKKNYIKFLPAKAFLSSVNQPQE